MRTLEIQINKNRILLLLVVTAIVIPLGVLLVYFGYLEGEIPPELTVVLVFAIPFLMYFFWTTLQKVINKSPGLVLDNRGILDPMNFSEIGIISWENITQVKIVKHQFSEFLLIQLKNDEVVLNRLSGLKKTMSKNYINAFGTPIVLTLNNLKIDKFELIKIIQDKIQAN